MKISLNDYYDHLGHIYQMPRGNKLISSANDEPISPIAYLTPEPWFTLNEIVDFLSYTCISRLSHLHCSNIIEPDDQMHLDMLTQ